MVRVQQCRAGFCAESCGDAEIFCRWRSAADGVGQAHGFFLRVALWDLGAEGGRAGVGGGLRGGGQAGVRRAGARGFGGVGADEDGDGGAPEERPREAVEAEEGGHCGW